MTPLARKEGEMDVGKSFAFVFEDKEWVSKLLIAAAVLLVGCALFVLALIPTLLAFLVLAGYGVEITRRVIRGQAELLPRWENWESLLVDGLKVAAIGIAYALPMIVLSAFLGPLVGWMRTTGGVVYAGSFVFGSGLSCVSLLWGIVLSLLLPAAIALYAQSGELRDAFRFADVYSLVRNNPATYVITVLMVWVAGAAGWLGLVLCCIGWFVTMPYFFMVTAHLYGQAYTVAHGQGLQRPTDPVVRQAGDGSSDKAVR